MQCTYCREVDLLSISTLASPPLAGPRGRRPKCAVFPYADAFPINLPTTATGLTATGILHLPRRPAARMSATVTMPRAEGSQR